jgi:hypothetical protein
MFVTFFYPVLKEYTHIKRPIKTGTLQYSYLIINSIGMWSREE